MKNCRLFMFFLNLPLGSCYLTVPVPSNKKLFDGTVPSNKKLYDGIPKKGRKGAGIWEGSAGKGREGRGQEGAGEGPLALRLGATIEKERVAHRGG
jgi:hypothetical protein